jgi:hypothetical protein
VLLRVEIEYPPVAAPAPRGTGKVGELLSGLSQAAANSAQEACPSDAGVKGNISITYLSETVMSAQDAFRRNEEEAEKAKDKSTL